MSDFGVVSHKYKEWNGHLNELRQWLMSLMKMRDGFLSPSTDLEIGDVRYLLSEAAAILVASSVDQTSSIPLTLQRKIRGKFENNTDVVGERLLELLQMPVILPQQLTDDDISILTGLLASVDDEVASLYNRMRRLRM